MKAHCTILFIVLILIISPAALLAQGKAAAPSGDPPAERVRIQPEARSPAQPTSPERAPDRAVPLKEELLPVSHLWGDVDGDGLKDLFVLNLKGNVLFRNLGDGDFEEVTAMAFPDGAGKGLSGFFGDYNGDETEDLFLFHEEGFDLFRNEGKFRFTKVTEELGLDPGLSKGCARLEDYDGDGFNDLLVKTEKGDRIFRSREGKEYVEVLLSSPDSGRGGMAGCGKTMGPVPPVKNPGGPLSPGAASGGGFTANTLFVNDNSPGSVGVGIPEVEGGDDSITLNDIVDGTITGTDIQNGSVPAGKVTGTAATLTGNQNFDSGTLYVDATNNRVGMGTTTPSGSRLHIINSATYGCRVENSNSSGTGVYGSSPDTGVHGYSTKTTGYNHGVYGVSDSNEGNGVFGEVTSATGQNCGVRGRSTSEWGRGVYGIATHATGKTYGVWGESSSTLGRGVLGTATAASGETYGVQGWNDSTTGRGVYGRATANTGENYGVYGKSDSDDGTGVFGYNDSPSGMTFGVRGDSESTGGRGVFGYALATSGPNFGVLGGTKSTSGYGVCGVAESTTGTCYGVHGETFSTSGRGVYGHSNASSGSTYGVYGLDESTSGRAIYGYASASSGTTYGVRGYTASTSGRGVYGSAGASSGTTYGVKGYASSPDGYGVYGSSSNVGVEGLCTSTYGYGVHGYADASSGFTTGVFGNSDSVDGYGVAGTSPFVGVYGTTSGSTGVKHAVSGVSSSSSGRGVSGTANAASGTTYGVRGESYSTSGRGVYGDATATTGTNYGVRGRSASTSGRAVYGSAVATSGTNYGVRGHTSSSTGWAVYGVGDLGCSGTKYFVQPHPKDPSKEIRFVCLEGNESGTYFRGSSKLENGSAVIEVPEEFRLVTEPEGLTVQFTPSGPARLWFEEKSLDRIVVRGDMDVEFDYFVNGVRRGFAKFEPIRENHEWVPEYKDKPFGTQYPEALRRILVENGTLNSDFTPNMKTAARMGWELRDFEEENDRLADAKKPVSPDRFSRKRHDLNEPDDRDIEPPPRTRVDLRQIEKPKDPEDPREASMKPSRVDEAPSTREATAKKR